jgi:hypothetical protein
MKKTQSLFRKETQKDDADGYQKRWGGLPFKNGTLEENRAPFQTCNPGRGLLFRTDTLERYRVLLPEMKAGQNAGHLS